MTSKLTEIMSEEDFVVFGTQILRSPLFSTAIHPAICRKP